MTASKIMAFIHCAHCVREAKGVVDIDVGLIDQNTLRVWCNAHQLTVYDFDLKKPIPVRCDVCGEEAKPGHHH